MKKLTWLKEHHIFYLILFINIILPFTVKFYPSMDGPSHLYNSNIIVDLVKGHHSLLKEFFTFNTVPVPNWVSHFFLALFNFILPAWLAEKILITFYIAGLAVSFRLLVKELNPDNAGLSILIFPFTYSILFHLGFYNHSLSFVFLFYTLYYWIRTKNEQSVWKYFVVFVLLIFTYFSSALVFGFLGFCLGLFLVLHEIMDYRENKNFSLFIRSTLKKLLLLLIISLPGLLLSLIFYKETTFFHGESQMSSGELVKWLVIVRPIIVYTAKEEIFTRLFLYLFIVIVPIAIYFRFRNNAGKSFLKIFYRSDIILLPALTSLILLFVVLYDSGVGMMSERYCHVFYMLLILWMASLALPKITSNIVVVLIISLHLSLLFKHYESIRNLNKHAKEINFTSNYVERGSVVLSLNLSDNWLEFHFDNYLGVDKPMVLLENYEAGYAWFPIRWNYVKMVNIILGDKKCVPGVNTWIRNSKSPTVRQIDYVLIYGTTERINGPKLKALKEVLTTNFNIIYTSEDKYAVLYAKK